MQLIDIGANLTHDSFDRDRDAVWQRARDAGVTRAILTGASREHSPKPLFLHQRDAHADFMAMMKNFEGKLGPAVVHCFTGTRGELFDYLDQDWHVGITGWLCDERRGQHLRELVGHIPANRLMTETDAPYLLPRTVKPQPSHRRNEPMYLAHIVAELARDRGEDVALAAANTAATAAAFFRLPD